MPRWVSTNLGVVGGLSIGIFAAAKMAHLIDDETVAKMGAPDCDGAVRCGPPVATHAMRLHEWGARRRVRYGGDAGRWPTKPPTKVLTPSPDI
jgi:hypothetical protein